MKKRALNLLNYSFSCIHRYKIRTAVILICLVTAAAVFSSVAFIKDGLVKGGELSLQYAPDITVQGFQSGRPGLVDMELVGNIQESTGTTRVIPRVWGYGNIGNVLVVIMGIDLNDSYYDPQQLYPLEAGSLSDLSKPKNIVLGRATAELLDARVGTILTIINEKVVPMQFQVIGIFNSESNSYNADIILMNAEDIREFFDIPEEKATDIAVYVRDIDLVNNVAREISEFPNVRAVTKDILLKAQETTYGARAGYFSVLWYVILIAVAIIAFNQTVVIGHESKFEVGLLKALGFSTTDVIQIRLMESAILGVVAGTIGIAIGIIYDRVLNAPVLREFIMGWATVYPSFSAPLYINLSTIFLTYTITIIPLLFATVIPSWINATVDPDISMRGASA